MVINKKGGKKGKKGKKPSHDDIERPLILKEENQEYCQVVKLLGNCRVEGNCFDGKTRLCHIRGAMRKKIWIKPGDIIIISLREFEDDKADIIYLYQAKEVKRLVKLGEIPETVKVTNDLEAGEHEGIDDIGIDFKESDDEEDDEEIDEETKKLQKMKDDFKRDFESNFNTI